jgi:ATP-dependent Clp protease ATP-binding subunit ClpA
MVFERFTHGAREAVVMAQAEARGLRHPYVGTEHLLLGVARVPEAGGRVLRRVGFDTEEIRAEIVRRVGTGPIGFDEQDTEALRSLGIDLEEIRRRAEEAFGPGALERGVRPRRFGWRRGEGCGPFGPGRVPFTPRAKKALELSLREAVHLGHHGIGTEHVLLGLVREGEGIGPQILVDGGADLRRIRRMIIEELRGPGDGSGSLVPSA